MKKFVVAVGASAALAVGVLTAVPASAAPQKPTKPYPDISRFAKLDFEGFQLADKPGIWFSTPSGLNCGIWDDGSTGCTGTIPGAPGGANQVGWFSGESNAHFDNTDQLRFVAGVPQRVLPADNYVEYKNAKCGVTPEGAVYCASSGNYAYSGNQFMVSTSGSWIGPQVYEKE